MEKKRNMDQGFDWKKKKEKKEGSALVKTSSTPSYAAGRDSVQTATMPYAPGLQAGVNSQTKPEKTEQVQEPEPEPEIPKENGNPPYIMGRDEGKPPEIPYGAGPQAGIKSQPPAPKPPTQSGDIKSEPYIMDRDEGKPPEIPYAAGLQAGGYSQPKQEKTGQMKEPEPEPEKQAPRRTSLAVREELETLERSYDDMLQEAEAWESQAARQETPEKMSRWEKKGRNLRKKAAGLEPYLDSLQKEWEYAMDWEWEAKKEEEGYRDPTFRDLTIGSFQKGYDTAQFGRESFRDMLGDEDNRKEEYQEKLAGEAYKFMPEKWWEKWLSNISSQLGEEVYKARSPEALTSAIGAMGTTAVVGQLGPQAMFPEEAVTVPGAGIMGHKAGSIASNVEIQAGLAYDKMRENGVSEETARGIAMIIGGVDGAIDVIPMDSIIDSVKILDGSGVSEKAIELFGDAVEKVGVDISPIIETVLKTRAQEGVSKAGVEIGIRLEGEMQMPTPEETGNAGVDGNEGNPWISDDTARKLLENQSMLDYLARWGDLKLTKGMKLEERISAVKEAVAKVIRQQQKELSD